MKTTGNVMARAVVAKESRRPHSKPRSCASKSFTLLSLAALDCTGVDDLERNAAGLSAEVRVIDVTHRSRRYAVLVALSTCIFGCDPGGTSGRTSPGNPPALATISGSEMQSGFASGPLRHPRTLSSYKITKYPITWAEYDACVRAGGCKSADASACSDEARAPYAGYTLPDYEHKADESPAVCVGERNAETYCKWIGGSLPTLDEWLLAARGTQPRRFSWGDAPSACDQHVMVPQLLQRATIHGGTASAEGAAEPCEQPAFDGAELAVGKHAAGASPAGVEDVLLVPAELLRTDGETIFNACGENSTHCVVFGLQPAAIDSVEPFFKVSSGTSGEAHSSLVAHAYSFRCVIGAEMEGAS